MAVADLQSRLAELDALVDPVHAGESERLQRDALAYREVERLPAINPSSDFAKASSDRPVRGWPTFPYSEAFHDPEKMLVNELAGVYAGAVLKDDRVYTIRANYGVGGIASMFGCKISLTMNNMPWCEHLSDDGLLEVLDLETDVAAGLGGRVFETERFYLEVLSEYSNLRNAVRIFVSDTQGPFDCAHLVIGHRIYTDIYDRPELVHRVLDKVTEAYIRFTKAQKAIIGEDNDSSCHSQIAISGGIRICEDSPTNISPAAYLEFCRPYNERLLREFGGGWIHYCGNGHQIFPHVISTPGLTGINFGNPEMQDLSAVYQEASHRGVGIVSWSGPFTPEDERSIKTGITLTKRPI